MTPILLSLPFPPQLGWFVISTLTHLHQEFSLKLMVYLPRPSPLVVRSETDGLQLDIEGVYVVSIRKGFPFIILQSRPMTSIQVQVIKIQLHIQYSSLRNSKSLYTHLLKLVWDIYYSLSSVLTLFLRINVSLLTLCRLPVVRNMYDVRNTCIYRF